MPTSKKRRHRKGGGRKQPRAQGAGSPVGAEPDLVRDVRRALRGHPIELLSLCSSLLELADPRRVNPMERSPGQESVPSLDQVFAMFVDVPIPETSALLAVFAALVPEEAATQSLRRVVAERGHHLPKWIGALDGAEAYRAVEMTHLLGDGDDVIIAVRLPTGEELCAVVYIDHNMGTLVKDAFFVPAAIAEVIDDMGAAAADPDVAFDDIATADARVRVTEAIGLGAMTVPPLTSETWPAARPLVEWVVSLLPEGGKGYQRPDWDETAVEALADRFLSSPHAAGLNDDDDYPELLESLLWFGTDYGPGDPLRWSPVAVEIFLVGWVPRKIVAPADYLSKMPDLLRAFVHFAHAERGVRPELTAETLEAVNEWEPQYQDTIRSPRLQGPAALLESMGLIDPDSPWPPTDGQFLLDNYLRLRMEVAVGGPDALDALDDEPLPDEDFAWDGIEPDIHPRVAEVLTLVDRCCDELFGDVEYHTACRRFLAAVATGDPSVFRRKARADIAAATVCWIVASANGLFHGGSVNVKDMAAWFGIQPGAVYPRADTLLAAAGMQPRDPLGPLLGSPRYLTLTERRSIILLRDGYV